MTDVACSRCGRDNPAGAKFCLECGNALAAATRTEREERKVVSVLFADIVEFTSHAEGMDPEDVRALLAPYHARLRGELERYGGTVEKFIGDAVMALFGAPVSHEDDPERAVRAALAIRDALVAEGRLHVRIGITTGEALVALDARPESGEGMASGDVVNTAARLQGAAPVDGVLVDEATYRSTARLIEYAPIEPVAVKGKAAAVPVWSARGARAGFGVDVRHAGASQLVGRTRELDLLIGALERARSERQPQLVTIIGVPGIGKSRIVWELFRHADRGDELVQWRQGRALPYAERITYWALGEMIKAQAGVLETDSPEEASGKLSQTVRQVAEPVDADWIERHLRPLVGVEPGTELRGDHRGEAFAAWRTFIECLADRRVTVLVFEDLHWADDGLLDFVDYLVDRASDVPLLVVGTSRPELLARRPGWGGGKPNALTISLGPLSDAETSALVAGLVERAVIPDRLREAVLERAAGNPLYAEEFGRLVAEGGRIDGLPDTVQGIISARLDTLDRAQKGMLQDAAVMGKVFWSSALAAMGDRERLGVEDALHALERREFVRRERRSSVAGESEYAFRHILVRDVAYGQIPRSQRADRHTRAAEWMESMGRPADHAELLAQHYISAIDYARASGRPVEGHAERAQPALAEAGDRALSLNAFPAAVRYFAAALDLTAADDSSRPRLLFRLGKAVRMAEGRGDDMLAQAEAALLAARDVATAAEAAVLRSDLAWDRGDGERTREHIERAGALVEGLPASHSKAYVLSAMSRHLMLRGDARSAIEAGRQAIAIAEELGFDEILAHALNNVGSARWQLGDSGGIADLERAIKVADAANSMEVARAMNNLASSIEATGDSRRARELWRSALAKADELGNLPVRRFVQGVVATFDFHEGSWDHALVRFGELIEEIEAGRGHPSESVIRSQRAAIAFARGDVDGALADVEQAVEAGIRSGDPQVRMPSLGTRIWLLTLLGRVDDANRSADELLGFSEVGDAIGAETIESLIRLGRRRDVARVISEMHEGSWRETFSHVLAGRYSDAADVLDDMHYATQAALMRYLAARRAMDEGRRQEALSQLDRALAFWRGVRADYWVQQAERLASAASESRPAPA